jgi:hypothetical protein
LQSLKFKVLTQFVLVSLFEHCLATSKKPIKQDLQLTLKEINENVYLSLCAFFEYETIYFNINTKWAMVVGDIKK